jgi:hypothetical protein
MLSSVCATLCLLPQAKVAAAVQQLPPTPRQQMLAQQAAAASQQLPTVITRLPEQFNAQVRMCMCVCSSTRVQA